MAKYDVWDPCGCIEMITFNDEKKAIEYKEKMTKKYGRDFRMKKIFNGVEKTPGIVEMAGYRQIVLNVKSGDQITSKEGFLMESPLTGKQYIVKKVEVCSSGGVCALEKEEISV